MQTAMDKTSAEAQSSTLLDTALGRLFNTNNSTEYLVAEITQKLHRIIDKRSPEKKENIPDNTPKETDMRGSLDIQLTRYDQINTGLQRINDHLSEII